MLTIPSLLSASTPTAAQTAEKTVTKSNGTNSSSSAAKAPQSTNTTEEEDRVKQVHFPLRQLHWIRMVSYLACWSLHLFRSIVKIWLTHILLYSFFSGTDLARRRVAHDVDGPRSTAYLNGVRRPGEVPAAHAQSRDIPQNRQVAEGWPRRHRAVALSCSSLVRCCSALCKIYKNATT